MTLRGEQPPPPKHMALRAWLQQAAALVDAVYAAAEANRLDKAARQDIVLRLDGRAMSMETILAAVRHHVSEEYPYLLRHDTAHNLTAIYASNLNDRYRISSLCGAEALVASPVKAPLAALSAHLDSIPPHTQMDI